MTTTLTASTQVAQVTPPSCVVSGPGPEGNYDVASRTVNGVTATVSWSPTAGTTVHVDLATSEVTSC
jgi:hypothetical protein